MQVSVHHVSSVTLIRVGTPNIYIFQIFHNFQYIRIFILRYAIAIHAFSWTLGDPKRWREMKGEYAENRIGIAEMGSGAGKNILYPHTMR
jgi:hypothetical protein